MDTIKLYFPSVDQDNHPLNQTIANKIYKDIIYEFSQISGGCTVIPCQGYYVNAAGQLINDDISLITCYTRQLDKMINLIKTESMLMLKALNQESIMYEVNDKVDFITLDNQDN